MQAVENITRQLYEGTNPNRLNIRYWKTDNLMNTFITHAVLVPLSSTVIPLPIYKVGYSINTSGQEVYDDESKLITVLVPLSSTVIPLPIYKVGYSINTSGQEVYDDESKLITAKKKKNAKIGAKVKPLSREDFEKKLAQMKED